MSVIKAVVFDVGDVLIEVNWKDTMNRLPITHSLEEMRNILIGWNVFDRFEKGEISADEFFHQLSDRVKVPLIEHDIHEAWNACLKKPVSGMPEIVQSLANNTKLFTLSNTCHPHYEAWKQEDLFGHFDELHTSHKWGMRKPGQDIYEKLIQVLNLKPQEILFFDDLSDNIEGARKLGIRAHRVYRNSEEVEEVLRVYDLLENLPPRK